MDGISISLVWHYEIWMDVMPSQNTQWYKDPRLVQYLDEMRRLNLEFMSKCYICGQKSEGINAIAEKLYPVCGTHIKD
jgi:hypothetical protein